MPFRYGKRKRFGAARPRYRKMRRTSMRFRKKLFRTRYKRRKVYMRPQHRQANLTMNQRNEVIGTRSHYTITPGNHATHRLSTKMQQLTEEANFVSQYAEMIKIYKIYYKFRWPLTSIAGQDLKMAVWCDWDNTTPPNTWSEIVNLQGVKVYSLTGDNSRKRTITIKGVPRTINSYGSLGGVVVRKAPWLRVLNSTLLTERACNIYHYGPNVAILNGGVVSHTSDFSYAYDTTIKYKYIPRRGPRYVENPPPPPS